MNLFVVFDCGGVLVSDVPNDMFDKLSLNYPKSEHKRIKNIPQRKFVLILIIK